MSDHNSPTSKLGTAAAVDVAYSPLSTRLSRYYRLNADDIATLEALPHKQLAFGAKTPIVSRGDVVDQLMLLISGWVVRCRYTRSGSRQIIHILLPGDIVTPDVFVLRRSDHEISTLSEANVRLISPRAVQDAFQKSARIAAAFWWAAALEDAVAREQILRLGRRSAIERVPHLFLELHRRLLLVHQATEENFLLPITQLDIADALGLSSVHVSRTLRKLVHEKLIHYDGTLIGIPSVEALASFCDFDTRYFHLDSTIDEAITWS